MDKQSKKTIVKNLRESFEKSSGVIVTHYLGLNSSELTDLREQVKAIGSKFCVAKNSLAKLASQTTDYETLNDFFTGPTALIFSEDALAGIKVIKKFSDKNDKLKFITASFDNCQNKPPHPQADGQEKLLVCSGREHPSLINNCISDFPICFC